MNSSKPGNGPASRTRAWHRVGLAFATAATSLASLHALAATSVMIWPIDPVIESDQRAAALWLENRDNKPVTLQVRVLGWREADGEERYDENQDRIAGSPPMTTVPPGKRQLIRLTRLADTAPGTEEAYRVLIDEIPQPEEEASPTPAEASPGVKFQMHYSIPLFVSGAGLWTKADPNKRRDPATAGQPLLGWRVATEGSKRWLVMSNRGPVHARITQLDFDAAGSRAGLGNALLGYVLPGAQMRWALPDNVRLEPRPKLIATVNGTADVEIAPDSAVSNQ